MATINGSNGADTLYGSSLADTINGRGGNDVLKGGGGADHLNGGAGIDAANYFDSTVGVTVNLETNVGGGGTAQGDTFLSIENLLGSEHDDQLIGDSFANVLSGGGGNDVLKGGGGDDTLHGGQGDDTLKPGYGYNASHGGNGIDTLDLSDEQRAYSISLQRGLATWTVNSHPDDIPDELFSDRLTGIENVRGSNFHDFIIGDDGGNVLYGRGGDDKIDGLGGADVMYGGTGGDHYWVDGPGDVVWEYAGEGHDTVYAGASFTIAPGNEIEWLIAEQAAGAVDLTGNEIANDIQGNDAANVIDGGAGADVMWGEGGNDIFIVSDAGDNPHDWVGDGFDTVTASTDFALNFISEIELLQTGNVAGTADIDLRGNWHAQTIIGNNGHNLLQGEEREDTLIGHDGQDVLLGGAHADLIDGGAGFDVASYETAPDALQVNLATGQGLGSHAQGDALTGIEGLIGSPYGDNLTGDANVNNLNGHGGADVLIGGAGDDFFSFAAGQANGDTVVDFERAGDAGGDVLHFAGYGAGATFTQVDATRWQVNYDNDTKHDVITFQNAPVFVAGDFAFV